MGGLGFNFFKFSIILILFWANFSHADFVKFEVTSLSYSGSIGFGVFKNDFISNLNYDLQSSTPGIEKIQKHTLEYLPFLNRDILEDYLEHNPETFQILDFYKATIFDLVEPKLKLALCDSSTKKMPIFSEQKDNMIETHLSTFRFTSSVFSWEDPKKLVSKDNDHLIPFDLLDAITKSNFELFFLQKTKYHDQFPIFTDLYYENEIRISKAYPLRITEILTYLIIISGLLAFFLRYYSYFNTREAKFG